MGGAPSRHISHTSTWEVNATGVPPKFNKRVEAMDADLAKPLDKRSLVPAQVVCVGVFRGQSGRKFAGGRGGVAEKAVWEYFGLEESAKSKSAFLVLLRLRWP